MSAIISLIEAVRDVLLGVFNFASVSVQSQLLAVLVTAVATEWWTRKRIESDREHDREEQNEELRRKKIEDDLRVLDKVKVSAATVTNSFIELNAYINEQCSESYASEVSGRSFPWKGVDQTARSRYVIIQRLMVEMSPDIQIVGSGLIESFSGFTQSVEEYVSTSSTVIRRMESPTSRKMSVKVEELSKKNDRAMKASANFMAELCDEIVRLRDSAMRNRNAL